MKTLILVTFMGLLIMVLGGCSTSLVMPDEATHLSSAYILKYPTPTTQNGHIVVIAETGFSGSGCPLEIYWTGSLITNTLHHGQRLDFYPPTGKGVLFAEASCLGRQVTNPLFITVDAHTAQIFEVGIKSGLLAGTFYITPFN